MGLGSIVGGIIGAGASLIGGRNDRRQRQREFDAQKPDAIRREAEKAGFNPLLFTNAAFQGVGYAPTFGKSIADAGAIIANTFTRERELQLRETELEQENQRLNDLVKRTTLKPHQPGVFQRVDGPTKLRQTAKPDLSAGEMVDNRVGPDVGGRGGTPTNRLNPPPRETVNLYIDVFDSDTGRWMTIPNPELMESGPLEMATGMAALGAADAQQNGPRAVNDLWDTFQDRSPLRIQPPVFRKPAGSSNRRDRRTAN